MLRLTILLYESNANWGDILCGWQNHDIIGWIDENILVNANIIDPYSKRKNNDIRIFLWPFIESHFAEQFFIFKLFLILILYFIFCTLPKNEKNKETKKKILWNYVQNQKRIKINCRYASHLYKLYHLKQKNCHTAKIDWHWFNGRPYWIKPN